MKTNIFFLIFVFISSTIPFYSYSNVNDEKQTDKLYALGVIPIPGMSTEFSVVFTGDDIKSFNVASGEIVFIDSIAEKLLIEKGINHYPALSVYLNDKMLFENIWQLNPTSSIVIHDLVFFFTEGVPYFDGEYKYYFLFDGGCLTFGVFCDCAVEEWQKEQDENFQKRKSEWDIFIKYLSDRGKIITGKEEIKPAPPIQIYSSGKTIHINNETGKNSEVSVYRIDGVKVTEQTMASQTATVEIPVSGFYLVSVRTGNEKPVMEKVVVR